MGPDSIIHFPPFKQSPIKLSNFEASLSYFVQLLSVGPLYPLYMTIKLG